MIGAREQGVAGPAWSFLARGSRSRESDQRAPRWPKRMSEEVITKVVVVRNRDGIHLRPAGLLADCAARYQAEIQFSRNSVCADGKSIMSILTLSAAQGTELEIRAKGPDAQAAVHAIVELFEQDFCTPGKGSLSDTHTEQQPPADCAEGSAGEY